MLRVLFGHQEIRVAPPFTLASIEWNLWQCTANRINKKFQIFFNILPLFCHVSSDWKTSKIQRDSERNLIPLHPRNIWNLIRILTSRVSGVCITPETIVGFLAQREFRGKDINEEEDPGRIINIMWNWINISMGASKHDSFRVWTLHRRKGEANVFPSILPFPAFHPDIPRNGVWWKATLVKEKARRSGAVDVNVELFNRTRRTSVYLLRDDSRGTRIVSSRSPQVFQLCGIVTLERGARISRRDIYSNESSSIRRKLFLRQNILRFKRDPITFTLWEFLNQQNKSFLVAHISEPLSFFYWNETVLKWLFRDHGVSFRFKINQSHDSAFNDISLSTEVHLVLPPDSPRKSQCP